MLYYLPLVAVEIEQPLSFSLKFLKDFEFCIRCKIVGYCILSQLLINSGCMFFNNPNKLLFDSKKIACNLQFFQFTIYNLIDCNHTFFVTVGIQLTLVFK